MEANANTNAKANLTSIAPTTRVCKPRRHWRVEPTNTCAEDQSRRRSPDGLEQGHQLHARPRRRAPEGPDPRRQNSNRLLQSQWNDRMRAHKLHPNQHRHASWAFQRHLCTPEEIQRLTPPSDTVINAERALIQVLGSSVLFVSDVVVEVVSAHHVHFAGDHSRLHSSVVPPAIEMQSNVICMERCIVLVSILGEYLAFHTYKALHMVLLVVVVTSPPLCERRSLPCKSTRQWYISSFILDRSSRKLGISSSGCMAEWYGVLRYVVPWCSTQRDMCPLAGGIEQGQWFEPITIFSFFFLIF
jgi:hypothetical protein